MRVNVYAEEMTDRVQVIAKTIDGVVFTGLRFYLELPVTDAESGEQRQGPFMHHPGDDDSSAITFWGKRDLRGVLDKALKLLDDHYDKSAIQQPGAGYVKAFIARGEPYRLAEDTAASAEISDQEFIDRYATRIAQVLGLPSVDDMCIDSAKEWIKSSGKHGYPEDAADEELSCWND